MYKCIFCGKTFTTNSGCGLHAKYCRKNPDAVKCKTSHVAWNKGKTAETDKRVAKGKLTRHDNIVSGKTVITGHPQTKETRSKLSVIRKQYLLEHPEKHVWKRNSKFTSQPCEYLKQKLRELNISFIEEFSPFTDSAIAIDIAFPDILLGIEVNGNQHYNRDGSLADYYQQRHDKLTMAGWKIYEIHYTLCYKLENFSEILNQDIYNKDYVNKYFSNKELETKRLEERLAKKAQRELDKKAIIDEQRQKLLSSGINFSRFGWVGLAAKVLGIKSQHVNNWMKRYLPDFYKTCFVRKK